MAFTCDLPLLSQISPSAWSMTAQFTGTTESLSLSPESHPGNGSVYFTAFYDNFDPDRFSVAVNLNSLTVILTLDTQATVECVCIQKKAEFLGDKSTYTVHIQVLIRILYVCMLLCIMNNIYISNPINFQHEVPLHFLLDI